MEKKSAIQELGISTAAAAGSGIVGGLMNQLFAGSNDRRQIRQQQKLTDMQVAANKKMADYEQELGLRMWKDTNYPAQVQMMKAAGLNPAAVLSNGGGGSGATGASAAGVGGGQAANAAQTQANQNELGLQMAQMQLMQAQTEKTKAEAVNIAGGEKDKLAAEVESLSQGVKNMKAKEELDKAQTSLVNLNRDILSATKDDAVKMVTEGAREAFHRANIAANQEYVNTQTTKTRIDTITAELNTALINNEATRARINLTKEKIKQITNDINISWEKLRQGDESNAIQAIFQVLSKDSNTANMKMDWAQEGFKKIFNDYMKAREK